MTNHRLRLSDRRRQILARMEGRRPRWNAHVNRLSGTVAAWVGTPRSLLHAFLAGLVADQLLATMRYRMAVMTIYRPLVRLLPLLSQARRLLL
ncbi:MAG: hypothetical protein ACXIUB_04025 [Wenzhouxiangella sp.]